MRGCYGKSEGRISLLQTVSEMSDLNFFKNHYVGLLLPLVAKEV